MSQPPQYNRLYNLTEYATANPAAPFNAAYTDAELNAIKASFYQTLINLALIQRDDGALKNNIVTLDSLNSSVAALMTAKESTIRGAWLTATAYALKDVVTQSGVTYICSTAHTSGTFATDLAAVKWVALNTGSSVAATAVSFTPAGAVAAVTVQAAIEEVDSEKLAKASNLSDLASRATAFTNLVAGGGTMTGGLTFSGARMNEAQGANVASAATIDLDAATGNLVDVTGTTTIAAITLSQGRESVVRFTGVLTLTNGASLVLPGAADIVTAAGDYAVFRGYASNVVRCVVYSKASGLPVVSSQTIPRAHLAGLTLSTVGGSATMSIAAGMAADSTNAVLMQGSAIAKTTSAWAVGTGNGGLDTGAIANGTWYAFYLIYRSDTGVVDVTFSLSGTSPTMPASYTHYRRIGWGLTNGSAQWVAFEQNGDEFTWIVPVNDVNATVTATANRTARTLTAAPSTLVNTDVYYRTSTTGVNEFCFLSSANMTDNAASVTNYTLAVSSATNPEYGNVNARYMLNSSRQMYDRGSAAGTMGYMTRGWIDRRGRDA